MTPVCPHHLTHLDQTVAAEQGVTEALQQGTGALLLNQLEETREQIGLLPAQHQTSDTHCERDELLNRADHLAARDVDISLSCW